VQYHLGVALRQAGKHEEAVAVFREAARLAEPLKLFATVQWALSAAGVSALGLDRLDEAAELFEATARTRSERGDPGGVAHVAHGKALIARARGDHEAAWNLFQAAYERYRVLGAPLVMAAALSGIAWSALGRDDLAAATTALAEMSRIAESTQDPLIQAWLHESEAHVRAARGDACGSLRSLDRAAELRRGHELPGLPFEEREVQRLRAILGASS
jgi:tetratricopeptide (TPR) repeat protein